ncbi:YcxB family protein [Streptomyces poriticola]|uniref:YcxB family protein n=1 Tax=Streptomyces poriticola TaxID=3120506 RepID=UPI002FCE4679
MENEERPAPGPAAVELAYVPTRADIAEALRGRARMGAPWWRLPLIAGLVLAAVLAALLVLDAPRGVSVLVVACLCPVLGILVGGCVHQLYRVRQMTRHARSQGEYLMRADGDGVHGATAVAETRMPWTSFRHCIETDNLFVLVVDETVGGMALLPKRGLRDGADVDGLRTVVARHIDPRSHSGRAGSVAG